MSHRLMVFVGGGTGAAVRFAVSSAVASRYSGTFPAGTAIINVTGCFPIGFILTILTERLVPHPNWRFLLVVGFLGGYTTFSSFEWETLMAVQNGHVITALLYVVASVGGGFLLFGAALS